MWDGAPKQMGVTHWHGSGMSCQGCDCCHQGSPAWMLLIPPPIASIAKVTGRSASGVRDYDELSGLQGIMMQHIASLTELVGDQILSPAHCQ